MAGGGEWEIGGVRVAMMSVVVTVLGFSVGFCIIKLGPIYIYKKRAYLWT